MGFMGLNHWQESDNAAGFQSTLVELFTKYGRRPVDLKKRVRMLVDIQLDDMANGFNTPGFVNVALCIEVQGVPQEDLDWYTPEFSKLLTMAQFRRMDGLFKREITEWPVDLRDDLRRLHKVIRNCISRRKR